MRVSASSVFPCQWFIAKNGIRLIFESRTRPHRNGCRKTAWLPVVWLSHKAPSCTQAGCRIVQTNMHMSDYQCHTVNFDEEPRFFDRILPAFTTNRWQHIYRTDKYTTRSRQVFFLSSSSVVEPCWQAAVYSLWHTLTTLLALLPSGPIEPDKTSWHHRVFLCGCSRPTFKLSYVFLGIMLGCWST